MSLLEKLLAETPRERSGARSSNRFEFQKDWALCHLLELHSSGRDYLIAFDYFDDVVEFDSEKQPSRVVFYQIKTKTPGNWTTDALIKSRKSTKGEQLLSHLGKLYSNYLSAGSATAGLRFVSNARFKIKVNSGSSIEQDLICLADATDAELERIRNAIKKEHSLSKKPEGCHLICLEVTPISLQEHSTHALGRVLEFIGRVLNSSIPAVPLYKTIMSEITRRTTYEGLPRQVSVFRQKKALSRSEFSSMLSSIPTHQSIRHTQELIRSQLQVEGMPFSRLKEVMAAVEQFLVKRLDLSDRVLSDASEAVSREIVNLRNTGELPGELTASLDLLTNANLPAVSCVNRIYSKSYGEAVILVALCHEE